MKIDILATLLAQHFTPVSGWVRATDQCSSEACRLVKFDFILDLVGIETNTKMTGGTPEVRSDKDI